jgi:2-methylisocitrate lyase-like PEP mutase family enzyme
MSASPHTATFRALHHQNTPLLLANAWDAGSALLMQSLGAKAVATTSAGLAWTLGYADGDHLPIALHVSAIQQITRVLTVPLTVDAESGYSSQPAQVADSVLRLAQAGAAGINLEDGGSEPALLCAKIEAIKNAAARAGLDVFINARTDVYLRQLAPQRAVEEALQRAKLYAAAGADGLFVPGATAAADIAALAAGQALPLNVMARPGLPPLAELTRLGVHRVSAGSAISQRCWATAKQLGASFLAEGSTEALFAGAAAYPEINKLMASAPKA